MYELGVAPGGPHISFGSGLLIYEDKQNSLILLGLLRKKPTSSCLRRGDLNEDGFQEGGGLLS